jgi:hypothetical protein
MSAIERTRCRFGNAFCSNRGGRPSRLKIEAARDAIDIKALPTEIELGAVFAFHCAEVHVLERNTATGDKLILVGGLSRDLEPAILDGINQLATLVFADLIPRLRIGAVRALTQFQPEPLWQVGG